MNSMVRDENNIYCAILKQDQILWFTYFWLLSNMRINVQNVRIVNAILADLRRWTNIRSPGGLTPPLRPFKVVSALPVFHHFRSLISSGHPAARIKQTLPFHAKSNYRQRFRLFPQFVIERPSLIGWNRKLVRNSILSPPTAFLVSPNATTYLTTAPLSKFLWFTPSEGWDGKGKLSLIISTCLPCHLITIF